jgi:hypothetical protein
LWYDYTVIVKKITAKSKRNCRIAAIPQVFCAKRKTPEVIRKKEGENKEIMVSQEQERIAKIVLDAAFEVHSYLGPGKDGIRRIVLNEPKTYSTSRLKNSESNDAPPYQQTGASDVT